MIDMSNERLAAVEKTLTTTLLGWAAASVVVGAPLALLGRKTDNPTMHEFGRQTAAWGAVDAAIAGLGLLSQRRRGVLSQEQAEGQMRKLRTLLVVNAVADVGYMAGGLAILGRSRRGQSSLRMGAGDGAAFVMQGAFLFALDVSQAMRLRDIPSSAF